MLISGATFAQKSDNVGIGTIKPDPSALLDLNSTSKGLLLPRMTQAQRNAIVKPATGLIIFQTDQNAGIYTYNGSVWESNSKTGATESTATSGAWNLQGNTIDGTDYIGSIGDESIRFKINGQNAGMIGKSTSMNTFLGYTAGRFSPGSENTAIGHWSMLSATSGTSNIAIGSGSMSTSTSIGNNNIAIGKNALRLNTANSNVAIGIQALEVNNSGSDNVAIGPYTLLRSSVGSNSVAIGTGALQFFNSVGMNLAIGGLALANLTTGNSNLAFGPSAGFNSNGSNNIFIGYEAGYNENGSNKLYISSSSTPTPLIGGDFTNNYLKFHTGTGTPTATAGFVAIGDFTAAGSTSTPGTGAINTFPAFNAQSKYRLIVQDGILTEKLKVALRNGSEWADYVFAPDYKLMSLEEVEKFTLNNKHLPNVPSADEMAKNGLDVTQTSAKLMEKIEELTLYMIQMNKDIKALKAENEELKNKLK